MSSFDDVIMKIRPALLLLWLNKEMSIFVVGHQRGVEIRVGELKKDRYF